MDEIHSTAKEPIAGTPALLIRLPDQKEYLAPSDCLPRLAEFARTFSAEIHRVRVSNGTIPPLRSLPSDVCDAHYRLRAAYAEEGRAIPLPEGVEPVRHAVAMPQRTPLDRAAIRARRNAIKSAIRARFLTPNQVVRLTSLREEFPDVNRTTLASYFSSVRNQLRSEGFTVNRVGMAAYQVGAPANMWGGIGAPGGGWRERPRRSANITDYFTFEVPTIATTIHVEPPQPAEQTTNIAEMFNQIAMHLDDHMPPPPDEVG